MMKLKHHFGTSLLLLIVGAVLVLSQSEIKGPPRAEVKVLKKIGHLGENIRLQCPIEGFPPPIFEWTKGGESIDFTWSRYKVNKKILKIKSAELEDTGVYGCKGINGFGSDAVRIELIIVDSSKYPSSSGGSSNEGIIADLAPPVFTSETKNSPRTYRKSVGESFQLSCEALGSPDPRMEWLKDGQVVQDESPNKLDGHSSVLDLSFLSASDSGSYTCRASNLIGQVDISFTLEVSGSSSYLSGNNEGLSTIVTEAGPRNGTFEQGSEAVLFCRVKSLISPHVQWLKKLDPADLTSEDQDSAFVLKVAGERFRMLQRNEAENTEKIASGEFLDRLILKNVGTQDSGMYICFVTSNGIGQLTYKSVDLNVVSSTSVSKIASVSLSSSDAASTTTTSTSGSTTPSLPVLISVICLAILFFCLTILSVVYVIRKRAGSGWTSKKGDSVTGNEKGESHHHQLPSTLPQTLQHQQLSCESRPFLMLSNSDKLSQSAYFPPPTTMQQQQLQQLQQLQHQKQHQLQQQLVYSDAQPLSSIGSQWSSTVYPFTSFGQQKLIPSFKSSKSLQQNGGEVFLSRTDSRLKDYENQPVSIRLNGDYEFPMHCVVSSHQNTSLSDRNNVYEVPYSHLFRSTQFSPEDEWTDPRSVNPVNPVNPVNTIGMIPKMRPQPLGGSTSASSHSIPPAPKNNPKNTFQDYESCYE